MRDEDQSRSHPLNKRNITSLQLTEAGSGQRSRELELLNRASQAFISTLELDQVLAIVLEEVRHSLDVVACSAWLIELDTDELVCRQVTDPQSKVVRGWRLVPHQGLAGWVAAHGQSLIVADTAEDPRHYKGVDEQTGLPIRSILTVPLRVKEETIGVIQVVDQQVGRFNANDQQVVESLASTAAIAIENARLFEALKASNREKEVLLKEVHHRVKNNLQIISSLLALQGEGFQNEEFWEPFRESQNRIQAMARVHEQLYQSQDLGRIDMAAYIQHLAADLRHSYGAYGLVIQVEVTKTTMAVDTAIPCGLIINELLSNALKHAFPGAPDQVVERADQVWIGLGSSGDQVELTICDNGVGLPPEVDWQNPKSLGLRLVNLLTYQLRGELTVDGQCGTTFKLVFRPTN